MAKHAAFILFGVAGLANASSVTYSAAAPQAYGNTTPCSSPLTGTINVPDSFLISDIDIRFIVSHPWRSDTNLTITSPDNTDVRLLVGNYGGSQDNYNVTFDDDAAVVVDTGAHLVNQLTTGPGMSVRSESDLLSGFDGEDAQGDWTYTICDVYTPADDGTLLELSLVFPGAPKIEAAKTVELYSTDEYALPGADVIYSISVLNTGSGSVDEDSIVLIDSVPPELTFYNGDMDDAGTLTTDPIAFEETSSGLTFDYAADAAYSNSPTKPADMSECTYTPTLGYDPNVTFICINPKGEFQSGSPDPEFSVSFRFEVQ